MKAAPLLLFVVLIAGTALYSQVPDKISYQGLLTTSSGSPVTDGNYTIRFDIYNAPTGGTLRHTDTQAGISVRRGTFAVILDALPGIFGESLFVEVTATAGPGIGSPITFSPRSELTSSPYALRADTAGYAMASLPGGPAGGDLSGTYPNPSIASNAVTLGKINPNGSASGQAIISTGTATPPAWGNPTTAPHVHDASDVTSGTMPVARGGTNNIALGPIGSVSYSDGTRYTFTAGAGANGQSLKSSGGGAPSWGAINIANPSEVTGTLGITNGGTGATTPSSARTSLGAAASGSNADITSITGLTTALSVNQGGTGGTSPLSARMSLGAAASGANSDITSLNSLITPLSVGQGGTGGTTPNSARASLGAAASGANNDITSMNALVTPLSAGQGGTGWSNYAVGDMLYATNPNALGRLSDIAVGNALLSGGIGSPPSWGKISLTSHVNGTLPVSNGGTGNGVPGVPGSIVYYSGPAYGYSPAGGINQLLKSGGAGAPAWGAVNLASATEVSGIVPIANGGTGSGAQNFVDLTTVQTANGNKTFGGNTTFQGTVTIGAGVNPGNPIFNVWSTTANLNFGFAGPTPPQTNTDLVVNVAGVVFGDVVMLGVPNGSVVPSSNYTAWVSNPGQVTVRFNNYAVIPQIPAPGIFRVAIMRF